MEDDERSVIEERAERADGEELTGARGLEEGGDDTSDGGHADVYTVTATGYFTLCIRSRYRAQHTYRTERHR
ncbi:hypothetical protein GCM10009021_10580 [Halarchaeum nitratireducens]|uniref:Uncharacterized protein n=1 Tax=Halarchaeum nitratireducens TaxID=489913 RepID=A0A830G8Q7_9EURY|nr:hypothetical protein GCM10009021_10580 [Halarchaeum nitratireducens]